MGDHIRTGCRDVRGVLGPILTRDPATGNPSAPDGIGGILGRLAAARTAFVAGVPSAADRESIGGCVRHGRGVVGGDDEVAHHVRSLLRGVRKDGNAARDMYRAFIGCFWAASQGLPVSPPSSASSRPATTTPPVPIEPTMVRFLGAATRPPIAATAPTQTGSNPGTEASRGLDYLARGFAFIGGAARLIGLARGTSSSSPPNTQLPVNRFTIVPQYSDPTFSSGHLETEIENPREFFPPEQLDVALREAYKELGRSPRLVVSEPLAPDLITAMRDAFTVMQDDRPWASGVQNNPTIDPWSEPVYRGLVDLLGQSKLPPQSSSSVTPNLLEAMTRALNNYSLESWRPEQGLPPSEVVPDTALRDSVSSGLVKILNSGTSHAPSAVTEITAQNQVNADTPERASDPSYVSDVRAIPNDPALRFARAVDLMERVLQRDNPTVDSVSEAFRELQDSSKALERSQGTSLIEVAALRRSLRRALRPVAAMENRDFVNSSEKRVALDHIRSYREAILRNHRPANSNNDDDSDHHDDDNHPGAPLAGGRSERSGSRVIDGATPSDEAETARTAHRPWTGGATSGHEADPVPSSPSSEHSEGIFPFALPFEFLPQLVRSAALVF